MHSPRYPHLCCCVLFHYVVIWTHSRHTSASSIWDDEPPALASDGIRFAHFHLPRPARQLRYFFLRLSGRTFGGASSLRGFGYFSGGRQLSAPLLCCWSSAISAVRSFSDLSMTSSRIC